MVATENECEFDDECDVFMFSCVDTSEGVGTNVVIVDVCGIADSMDKTVDEDDVVVSFNSDASVDNDNRGGVSENDDCDVCGRDVDCSEVDKIDVSVFVVTSISPS